MTVKELKKLLRETDAPVLIWVRITQDDGVNVSVTKGKILRILDRYDDNEPTSAVLVDGEVYLG